MILDRWMEVALGELSDHISETPGVINTERIVEYHSYTTLHATTDEVSWCSSFVCFCFEESSIESTHSAAARSWLEWEQGDRVLVPEFGDVAVLWRDHPGSAAGHVGFFLLERGTQIALLGGNQHDRVSCDWYPASRVLGYRRFRRA